MPTLPLAEVRDLARRALLRAGASPSMAQATADALAAAEAEGLSSHGMARVPQYATHLRNGRANGAAVPVIARERGGAILVDAREGLAFAACKLAVGEAIRRAGQFGVAFAGVTNSHHFGVAGWHLQPIAAAGIAEGELPNARPTNPASATGSRCHAATPK